MVKGICLSEPVRIRNMDSFVNNMLMWTNVNNNVVLPGRLDSCSRSGFLWFHSQVGLHRSFLPNRRLDSGRSCRNHNDCNINHILRNYSSDGRWFYPSVCLGVPGHAGSVWACAPFHLLLLSLENTLAESSLSANHFHSRFESTLCEKKLPSAQQAALTIYWGVILLHHALEGYLKLIKVQYHINTSALLSIHWHECMAKCISWPGV